MLAGAAAEGLSLRLIGGVAVALGVQQYHGRSLLFPRIYNDVDIIAAKGSGPTIGKFMKSMGYEPNDRFNALHGRHRLLYYDGQHNRKVDIFVGAFFMCHDIPIPEPTEPDERIIPLAELLLTKLQIFELNEKDLFDVFNLLFHHELDSNGTEGTIDGGRIARRLAHDWGLWRTSQLNLERTRSALSRHGLSPDRRAVIENRLTQLSERIASEPKSAKWKLRSRLGDRVRWYEEPDEVG